MEHLAAEMLFILKRERYRIFGRGREVRMVRT